MNLKLSPPWVIWYRDVQALFQYDSDVRVIFNEEKPELILYVEDDKKAYALMQLMPHEKEFGNVKLTVSVVPANKTANLKFDKKPITELYETAFKGNSAFVAAKEIEGLFATTVTYIIFRKQVVQYFSDNLGDYYGNRSTLFQTVAEEVFEPQADVYFCTDIEQHSLFY